MHPGLLVRALRRRVLAAGVAVHEHTPVTALRAGSPSELGTPGGTLRAPEVVLATNAALTGWKPASFSLTNFGSYVVLTEPAPQALAEIGWTGERRSSTGECSSTTSARRTTGVCSWAAAAGRSASEAASTTGSRGCADGRARRGGAAAPAAGLSAVRVERAWGGPIDVSSDHLPFFRTRPGTRIHYGAGYSGHGVGPSWLGGRILASLALGADDEWTRLPLATRDVPRLPPEPFRRVGGGLVRWAIMACEAAEEEARRPPLAARAGAALPRLLGMELGPAEPRWPSSHLPSPDAFNLVTDCY